jgi:hypothetical protein
MMEARHMSPIAMQVLLLSTFAGVLWGQQIVPPLPSWQPEPLSAIDVRPDSAAESDLARFHADDYRYEGLIFGGATLGVLGAWVGSQLSGACVLTPGNDCGTDRVGNAVMLGLTGAVIGGGVGYLVGRVSPKRPSPLIILQDPSPPTTVVPDSVRYRVGYQHWKGAAIGAGVGAVLGGVLVMVSGAGCADCTVTTGDRVEAVLLVTGGAGLLGFLAGLASPKYVWVSPEDAERFGSDSNRE